MTQPSAFGNTEPIISNATTIMDHGTKVRVEGRGSRAEGRISIGVVRLGKAKKLPIRAIKTAARRILELLDKPHSELSIALVGNEQIQALNASYRAKDEPTDVLSFPADQRLPDGTLLIGDVVISVEKAAAQASARQKSLDQEIEALLIHGILHNLGYDHERSARDARVMKAMERKLASALRPTNAVSGPGPHTVGLGTSDP